jgi:regulator of sigma E protease
MNSDFWITLLQFIIVFGFMLFFHEGGHFLFARLFGIEVEEFGFGFPPRLVRLFTWKGTEFTLNWIPFGAFVRPKGENDPEVPGGLAAANPWKRLGVLFGGPVMNIVIGILVFSLVFMQVGAPNTSKVAIVGVSENSPAASAGLQSGDLITRIGTTDITQGMEELSAIVKANLGNEIELTYQRDGESATVKITPRVNPPAGEGALGITMSNPYEPITWLQALPTAGKAAYQQTVQLVTLPFQLARGSVSPDETRMVGPKGMFDIYQQAHQLDKEAPSQPNKLPAVNVLWLIGTLSVALGLTNLLPIPALDGGRILFVLPELIFHKKVPQQYENLIHFIGFALLLLLMAYITLQDFINPIVLP